MSGLSLGLPASLPLLSVCGATVSGLTLLTLLADASCAKHSAWSKWLMELGLGVGETLCERVPPIRKTSVIALLVWGGGKRNMCSEDTS